MKKILLLIFFAGSSFKVFSQVSDSTSNVFRNTVEAMLNEKPGLSIGGYGEVHFNQPITEGQFDLGTLDAHRLVMFLGYNFSGKTQFVSEIEFEYAKELWIEQMFLQHKLNKFASFRAGILLVPMGIINEYHEPTTFNGVERPFIDNRIAPSTWREIGMGFAGNYLQTSTKYQLYIVNGFNGYDAGAALFSGSKALREGRQKGSKAYVAKPSLTGKIEFYGIRNLNIGLSGYYGMSYSRLFNKLDKANTALVEKADSSVVGISMIGADARYNIKGIKLTGQFYYTKISNTDEYNVFTGKNGVPNDLGSAMTGYYAEIGYNVFKPFQNITAQLMPFVRYEVFDTHHAVENPVQKNILYHHTVITTGLTYTLNKGAVLKADLQFLKSGADDVYSKVFNAGFGIMF